MEADSCGLKARNIEFRPAPIEVVHAYDAGIGNLPPQCQGKIGPHETSAACDEDFHVEVKWVSNGSVLAYQTGQS